MEHDRTTEKTMENNTDLCIISMILRAHRK